MRKRIVDAQALRQSIVASAITSERVGNKSTAKGQRSALANGSSNRSASVIEKEVWSAPSSFVAYCESEGLPFTSVVEALQVANSDDSAEALEALRAIASHRAYRSERFDEAFTIADVARLERREVAYQRFGGINLGLGGYSAEDVVQMAVIRSWNDSLVRYLVGTGEVSAERGEVMKQALNKRSLIDFEDAIEASDLVRYTVKQRNGYTLIVKHDVSKMNERIVRQAEAFKELAGMLNEQAERIEFTIGDVFKNILKVRRDGVAQIRRMLDGHTADGTFTNSIEFSVSEKSSFEFRSAVNANIENSLLVASAESDFFTKSFTVQDERQELIEALKSQDLVPAEAEAVAFAELLNAGYSLEELAEEVFADMTPRQFNDIQRTAQDLLRK
jgi:hypothetical protein